MSLSIDILKHEIFKRINPPKEKASLAHNKLAIRNNDEIIFAIDSSIRYTKLSRLGNSYDILDINVKFPINGIKLNSSGTLLAIYNNTNIIVTTLPKSNTSTSVKTFQIASYIYGASNKIIDILWNKIARYDSTLVILSEDLKIRTFEICYSLTEPKQLYNLSNNGSNQVGLVTNIVDNPVSISFGSSSKLSGLLTLYILNQEGDIFSIYPFIPEEISVEESSVEDLLNEIVLSTNSIFDDASANNCTKKLAIDQLRFINLIWKQIPLSQTEVRGSQTLKVLQSPRDEFFIQGPLSIQPYPKALYDDEALSLITLSNDTIDLLSISFKKNGIIILFQGSLFMRWNSDPEFQDYLILSDGGEKEEFTSVLTVLEHKVPKSLKPTYISPLNGLKFLLENDGNYYKVDLSELGKKISESIINGNIDDALSALTRKALFNKINIKDYEGSGVLTDTKGGNYEVVLSGTTIDVQDLQESTEERDESFEVIEKYNTLLNTSCPLEISKLISNLKQFKLNFPSQSINLLNPDENTLKIVGTVSSEILKQLMNHHKLGVLLNHRLIDQDKEMKRQVDKTNELSERLTRINVSPLEKILERQKELNERFMRLSELLQKNHPNLNLPLSTKEKQWFKEIHTLTSFFNTSLKRNIVLTDQIKTIKNELKSRPTVIKSNSVENWNELNQVLRQGKKLIAKTSEDLNQNLQDLNKQLSEVHI